MFMSHKGFSGYFTPPKLQYATVTVSYSHVHITAIGQKKSTYVEIKFRPSILVATSLLKPQRTKDCLKYIFK